MDEYIDLFPVHPSYFDNFQKIRVGRSQREILKTLSKQFAQIADKDIPSDNPIQYCLDLLYEWNLEEFSNYIIKFFKLAKEKNINDFSNFSIAYHNPKNYGLRRFYFHQIHASPLNL